MVKMPSLDDLKKVGAGLVDSAKSGKINEMVDKVKTGIDNFKNVPIPQGDEGVKNVFQTLYASLGELQQMQSTQNALIKNIENQVAQLAKIVAISQGTPPGSTVTKDEGKTTYENDET